MFSEAQRKFISPITSLLQARRHSREKLSSTAQHTVQELNVASLFAIGYNKIMGTQYNVRPIHYTEAQAPDAELFEGTYEEFRLRQRKRLAQNDKKLEVVEYTPYSKKETLGSFIVDRKLTNKSYEPNTVIVCHLNGVYDVFNWQEVHSTVAKAKMQYELWVLMRRELTEMSYVLLQLLPTLGLQTEFNILRQEK